MKTYKKTIFTVLTVLVVSVTGNENIKGRCPSEIHWVLRAKAYCSKIEQYTCLFDTVGNIYKENCNGPKTEPPGDKTVVNTGNFDTEPCSFERFQPFSFTTSQGNKCVYKKTICSEKGQLAYSNGTSRYDRKCRCDYTNNFSFVSTKRVDMCSCDPTNEDCSCYIKNCYKGQRLTPDYQCVNIEDSYGNYVCADIEVKSGQTTVDKLYEATIKNINEFAEKYGKTQGVLIVCGIVILGFLCMYLLLHPVKENIAMILNAARCKKCQQADYDNDIIDGNKSEILSSSSELRVQTNGIERLDDSNEQPGFIKKQSHSAKSQKTETDNTSVSFTNSASNSTNYIPHTDKTESSSETIYQRQLKDQTIKTEGASKYRINKALVETYRDRPYEYKVLVNLITDGTIQTYNSPDNMTESNVQMEQDTELKNLIIKSSRDYTICRRNVETPFIKEIREWAQKELGEIATE